MKIETENFVVWSCIGLSTISIPIGSFSIGMHLVAIFFIALASLATKQQSSHHKIHWIGAFFFVLIAHFSVSNLLTTCTSLFEKSALSFTLFLLIVTALARLAAQAKSQANTGKTRVLLIVVTVSVIIEKATLVLSGASPNIRPSGIFLEPSHLALSVAPIVAALIFSSNIRDKQWSWICLFLLITLSGSATLFITCTFSLIFSYAAIKRKHSGFKNRIRMLSGGVVLLSAILVSPYRAEFEDRITGVFAISSEANISSIVYVNGWEVAHQNILNTTGVGLGFNRMGCTPQPITATGSILDSLGLGDVNYNDGSFTFSKVASELGVTGVLIWALGVAIFIRMIQRYHLKYSTSSFHTALAISSVAVLIFGGLVRGTNYFSGPFILGIYFIMFFAVKSPFPAHTK